LFSLGAAARFNVSIFFPIENMATNQKEVIQKPEEEQPGTPLSLKRGARPLGPRQPRLQPEISQAALQTLLLPAVPTKDKTENLVEDDVVLLLAAGSVAKPNPINHDGHRSLPISPPVNTAEDDTPTSFQNRVSKVKPQATITSIDLTVHQPTAETEALSQIKKFASYTDPPRSFTSDAAASSKTLPQTKAKLKSDMPKSPSAGNLVSIMRHSSGMSNAAGAKSSTKSGHFRSRCVSRCHLLNSA
jgi:hypothetical protein